MTAKKAWIFLRIGAAAVGIVVLVLALEWSYVVGIEKNLKPTTIVTKTNTVPVPKTTAKTPLPVITNLAVDMSPLLTVVSNLSIAFGDIEKNQHEQGLAISNLLARAETKSVFQQPTVVTNQFDLTPLIGAMSNLTVIMSNLFARTERTLPQAIFTNATVPAVINNISIKNQLPATSARAEAGRAGGSREPGLTVPESKTPAPATATPVAPAATAINSSPPQNGDTSGESNWGQIGTSAQGRPYEYIK